MESASLIEPRGVQMTRHRPWRADHPTAVIVARPTRWGNPWRVGDLLGVDPTGDQIVRDAEHAVRLFGNWIASWRRRNPVGLGEWLAPLRGRDLACWCPIGSPCHRDLLIKLANADQADVENLDLAAHRLVARNDAVAVELQLQDNSGSSHGGE